MSKRSAPEQQTVKLGARGSGPSDVPEYLRATLRVASGDEAGRVFPLKGLITLIGRGETAHVRIDHEGVSREHAAVSYHAEAREFRVSDMRSANGTLLNGSRVTEYALRDGDKLLIGETLLVFAVERDPAADG